MIGRIGNKPMLAVGSVYVEFDIHGFAPRKEARENGWAR